MDKFMRAIEKLEDRINNIKDLTEDYIKSLPIYDMLRDQIEKVKYSKHEIKFYNCIHIFYNDYS